MAYSNKHIRVETKKTAITKYSAQQSYEKNLKTLNDSAKFNQDIYDMETEWFNLGYSIDEAPEELKSQKCFNDGFRRGQNLARIEEYDKQKSGRSK